MKERDPSTLKDGKITVHYKCHRCRRQLTRQENIKTYKFAKITICPKCADQPALFLNYG